MVLEMRYLLVIAILLGLCAPALASDVGQWEYGSINVRRPTSHESSPDLEDHDRSIVAEENSPFKGMKVTHVDSDGHEFVRSD
jgi:hypothetical protein